MPAQNNRGPRYARFSHLNRADLALFRAALAGEHAIQGFRNTDLTRRLYSPRPRDREEARRRCERTSRLIVKLRYRVTPYGQRVMTAAVALHDNRFADNYNAAA